MGNNRNFKNVMFKTSIGGYKKSNVNDYIESENRRFAELETSYTNTIDSLKRMLDNAEKEIDRLRGVGEALGDTRAKLDKVTADNELLKDELKKTTDEYTALISEKNSKIKEVEEALAIKDSELAEKTSFANELAEQNTVLKNSADEAKAEAARLSSELESISKADNKIRTDIERDETAALLGRAREATENMLKRAEESASIILDRAHKEALDYREELFSAAKEVFDAATEELRRSIGICMSDFISGIKHAKGNTERAKNAAFGCEDDLSRRIERMQNDLDRAIAEKLAEFDCKRK